MKPFLLSLSALSLLTLAACQTSPEPGGAVSPATSPEAELRLVVKDEPACLELRDIVKAGEAGDSLRAHFRDSCLVPVPPAPREQCARVMAQIDSGLVRLAPGFAQHCAPVCDSLAATDSAAYLRYCVVPPRPVLPERPTLPERPDPCARAMAEIDGGHAGLIPGFAQRCAAVCDSLATEDSAAYRRYCVVPPRPAPPSRCVEAGRQVDRCLENAAAQAERCGGNTQAHAARCGETAARLAGQCVESSARQEEQCGLIRARLEAHCSDPATARPGCEGQVAQLARCEEAVARHRQDCSAAAAAHAARCEETTTLMAGQCADAAARHGEQCARLGAHRDGICSAGDPEPEAPDSGE